MTAKLHLIMSRQMLTIVEQETGITINRRYFLLGSVYPDYSYNFFFHKHKTYKSLGHIKAKIEKLCCHNGVPDDSLFSFSLGIVIHYICDFFCMPHNEQYTGTFRQHYKYEAQLKAKYRYRKNILPQSKRIFPEYSFTSDIFEYLDRMLMLHHSALSNNSFVSLSDVPRAMEVATQVMLSICSMVSMPNIALPVIA